jgi:hypothetical protein
MQRVDEKKAAGINLPEDRPGRWSAPDVIPNAVGGHGAAKPDGVYISS